MVDLFVSYSRKDKSSVQALVAALTAQNRDVWVDWEDIPLTADWWQEICRGIEAADAVVFVMTDQSLASAVCTLEIAHALAHNKRLIPIVQHPPDNEKAAQALADYHIDDVLRTMLDGRDLITIHRENWLALARINWIYFRPDAPFNEALDKLITALDTDLAHVRTHTRLVSRAVEWQQNQHNGDLLLQGDDCTQAETWLATAATATPQPTNLQRQYIQASRRAENRRVRRRRLLSTALTVIVTVVLTIVIWQRDRLIPVMSCTTYLEAATSPAGTAIPAFEMDCYEVTEGRYVDFRLSMAYPLLEQNLPIVNVTYDDALTFCEAHGGQLPTEMQWARALFGAKMQAQWPWGAASLQPDFANYASGARQRVGSYRTDHSAEGVYDLVGNVEEWVTDLTPAQTSQQIRGLHYEDGDRVPSIPLELVESNEMFTSHSQDTLGFRCVYPIDSSE